MDSKGRGRRLVECFDEKRSGREESRKIPFFFLGREAVGITIH